MTPKDYCILIAEDDVPFRHAVVQTLSGEGYCLIQANDGAEAMQLEAEYDGMIQLLVTDVRMPRMDGHELATRIKGKRPAIKVLILSGEHEEDFPPEARSHDLALLKSATLSSVLTAVAKLLPC